MTLYYTIYIFQSSKISKCVRRLLIDSLQGIKRFIKIAGIPNLEKYIQEAKKERHRL